jgi:hypothetical protein
MLNDSIGYILFGDCSVTLLTDHNQIAQLAEGLPGCMFNDLLKNDGDSERWLALLREFVEEPPRAKRSVQDIGRTGTTSPQSGPLQKVQPGPWRSLGGYLDYSHWEDRERFLELDAAIARARQADNADDESEDLLTAA